MIFYSRASTLDTHLDLLLYFVELIRVLSLAVPILAILLGFGSGWGDRGRNQSGVGGGGAFAVRASSVGARLRAFDRVVCLKSVERGQKCKIFNLEVLKI